MFGKLREWIASQASSNPETASSSGVSAVRSAVDQVLARPEELGKDREAEKALALELLAQNTSPFLQVENGYARVIATDIVGAGKRQSFRATYEPYFIADGNAQPGNVGVWFERGPKIEWIDGPAVGGAPGMSSGDTTKLRAATLAKRFGAKV